MRSLQSVIHVLGAPFVSLWFLLWNCIPDRCKRMCMLASLYARLAGCNEDDTEQLEQVNRTLRLSRDTKALRFPAVLAPVVWPTVININKIDPTRSETYITKLIKRTPCWLAYANETEMRDDLRALMEYCQGRTCVTPTVA